MLLLLLLLSQNGSTMNIGNWLRRHGIDPSSAPLKSAAPPNTAGGNVVGGGGAPSGGAAVMRGGNGVAGGGGGGVAPLTTPAIPNEVPRGWQQTPLVPPGFDNQVGGIESYVA